MKHFIPGAPGKERRSVNKKRDVDDFWEANITQLICRKYWKSKIRVSQ
jgi:hypothetical protein